MEWNTESATWPSIPIRLSGGVQSQTQGSGDGYGHLARTNQCVVRHNKAARGKLSDHFHMQNSAPELERKIADTHQWRHDAGYIRWAFPSQQDDDTPQHRAGGIVTTVHSLLAVSSAVT